MLWRSTLQRFLWERATAGTGESPALADQNLTFVTKVHGGARPPPGLTHKHTHVRAVLVLALRQSWT